MYYCCCCPICRNMPQLATSYSQCSDRCKSVLEVQRQSHGGAGSGVEEHATRSAQSRDSNKRKRPDCKITVGQCVTTKADKQRGIACQGRSDALGETHREQPGSQQQTQVDDQGSLLVLVPSTKTEAQSSHTQDNQLRQPVFGNTCPLHQGLQQYPQHHHYHHQHHQPQQHQQRQRHRWYKRLWSLLSSTFYECKLGVSQLYPGCQFSMMAQAVVQECEDSKGFGVAVVIQRSDGATTAGFPHATNSRLQAVVGGSIKPRLVRPGPLSIRLVSSDFEADTLHGEHPSLVKFESDFSGRDFEKQFACKFKENTVTDGVFGKVLVEHTQPAGVNETVFEFNLTKGVSRENKHGSSAVEASDQWSVMAVKELAAMLHIGVDNNWEDLARHLGFTEREVASMQLVSPKDPFRSMLSAYQSRGGTPDEFVHAMYEVSRMLASQVQADNEETGAASSLKPSLSCSSSNASTLAMHSITRESSSCSTLRMSPESHFDADSGQGNVAPPVASAGTATTSEDYEVLRATSMLTGAPLVMLPSSQPPLPLTPPPTPRKRQSSSSESGSPKKLRRHAAADDNSCVFLFPDSDSDEQAHSECRVVLPSSVLWQLSAHVHQKWKSLGRTLDLPESELMCIEHANRDLRECTYQTLLKWQEMRPECFSYGSLFTALCDCGLKSIAHSFCTVDK